MVKDRPNYSKYAVFKQLAGLLLLFSFLTVKCSLLFADQQPSAIVKIHQSQEDTKEGNSEGEKESKSFSDELLNTHLICLTNPSPSAKIHIQFDQGLLQQSLPSPYLPPEL